MILIDGSNWPERNRKHKGATNEHYAFRRNMQENEMEQLNTYRLTWIRYNSWSDLVEDEKRILGEDHPFITVLENQRINYPKIPYNSPGKQVELF